MGAGIGTTTGHDGLEAAPMPVGAHAYDELVFAEGATFTRTWAYVEGPEGTTGLPAGWTTPGRWTGLLQVRSKPGNATVLLEASTALGSITLGTVDTDATVTLTVPADALVGMTWRDGYYDLKLRDTGVSPNFVVRLVQGRAHLDRQVTVG